MADKTKQKASNNNKGTSVIHAFLLLIAFLLLSPTPAASQANLSPFRAAKNSENENIVCGLARKAVETRVKENRVAGVPSDLPSFMKLPTGCFVTIVKGNSNVGCMGTLQPQQNFLAEEIIASGVMAATADPWHNSISIGELSRLKYIVSIPGELKRVKSSNQLDPAKLGLLVRKGRKSALLLPGEAMTPEWQVYECKRKAGIPQNEKVEMFIFETVVFGPR